MDYLNQFKENPCDCCSESHLALTKDIIVGKAVLDDICNIIARNNLPDDVLVVYDKNTYSATDGVVTKKLNENGFKVREYMFNVSAHANEECVGLLMFAMVNSPKMIIGIGSGSICDLSRFCAYKLNIPFMICGTAPSMDGYASTVAAMTVSGIKKSFVTTYPTVIIGDLDVLKNAPIDMIASGFGDIAGKVSALLDWKLGRIVTKEHYCEKIVQLTNTAVNKCFEAGSGLKDRNENAIEMLMNALSISGITMQLNGNSRPASGAEHHISHFLEMTDEIKDRKGAYHGAKVGMASQITLRLYEKLFSDGIKELKTRCCEQSVIDGIKCSYGSLSKDIVSNISDIYIDEKAMTDAIEKNYNVIKLNVETFAEIREKTACMIKQCKGSIKPQDLGYTREIMYNAIVYSRFMRKRFTILTALANWGLLEQYANEVLDEIF